MNCHPSEIGSGYPPLPIICHTSAPPVHDTGTAFTGPDLTGATLILVFLVLFAALALVLAHAFKGEE
jgi:hypothetical protein